MNLQFFKKKSLSSKRDYLFTLEIGQEFVRSAVWTVVNDRTQVISVGKTVICNPLTEESLLQACDQTLTDSTNRLDSSGKIQPEKIILGLPVDWVSQDKIEPQKLHLLRTVTQKLSLSAIGFVVTPQALVRFLQHSEGVPPTAILIGFWPHVIEVILVRLGKIESIQVVKRSNKIASDIVEGLSRTKSGDILPSRMLIYDTGSDLEEAKQHLLSFPWQAPQNKLSFLHFPKIEILPFDFSIKAISLAGGSEVAQAIGLISAPALPEESPSDEQENVPISPQALGFVSEIDITTLPETQDQSEPAPQPEFPPKPIPVPKTRSLARKFSFPAVKLPSFKFHRPQFPPSTSPIIWILIFIFLLSGLIVAYWFIPKAQVTVTVSPKTLQHEFTLVADPTATSVGDNAQVLPASTVEVTVTGQKSKSTTGSLLVGDKATGEVTIINGTAVPRTFTAGTLITSSGGLKFTFNTNVEVASASGTADPNSYQPGKATVKITADTIGSESNLTAGTQFKIGTFSTLDYVAKNDTAFSGGSSRQVAVVSRQDLTDLKTQLTSSLQAEAREKFSGNVDSGHKLLEETLRYSVISEKYNHALNDVADNLGLELSVKATVLEFSTSDLDNLVKQQISSLIPAGYEPSGNSQHSFSIKDFKDKQVILTVQVTSLLLPQINREEIIKNITGKYPSTARDYLTNIPGVSQINFRFLPPLPNKILTLPHITRNIDLVIEPEN